MNIKCLIFDCDGLMFNTEYYSRQNWKNMGKKYNLYNRVRYITQILELGYQGLNLSSSIYYLGILGKILNLTITQFSPLQNGMIKIPTSKGC